jgi:MFS family permease
LRSARRRRLDAKKWRARMGGTVIVTLARRSLLAVSAGAAFMVPASLALIRLSFHDAVTRRTAVAMWGACGGIALAAGPVIGGLMIQYVGCAECTAGGGDDLADPAIRAAFTAH